MWIFFTPTKQRSRFQCWWNTILSILGYCTSTGEEGDFKNKGPKKSSVLIIKPNFQSCPSYSHGGVKAIQKHTLMMFSLVISQANHLQLPHWDIHEGGGPQWWQKQIIRSFAICIDPPFLYKCLNTVPFKILHHATDATKKLKPTPSTIICWIWGALFFWGWSAWIAHSNWGIFWKNVATIQWTLA